MKPSRADRHHRAEAKAARRRRRRARGTNYRRLTAPQEAARAWYGDQNIRAIRERARVVAENRRREAAGKRPKPLPVLMHFRGPIPGQLIDDLGLLR